jgi:hypothetical protein
MVSPFHGYDDLTQIWGHAVPVVSPRTDIVVTVRFPGETFKKLQEHLARDSAVLGMSRLLQFSTADVRLQMRGVFSESDIANACSLTLDQVHAILDAPSDCDAAMVHLMDKRIACFKWNESPNGSARSSSASASASELDVAVIDVLDKVNRIVSEAEKTLAWSKGVVM